MKRHQQGIGMIEVLVALIILAVAVLGFSAMQFNAVASSIESGNNIHATNLARDLSERLRMNREGLVKVIQATDNYSGATASTVVNCNTQECTSEQLAAYDFSQVNDKAARMGMTMAILPCQGGARLQRSCIYVAWDNTTATDGNGGNHCTNGDSYNQNAKCLIMEIYNHE